MSPCLVVYLECFSLFKSILAGSRLSCLSLSEGLQGEKMSSFGLYFPVEIHRVSVSYQIIEQLKQRCYLVLQS